MKVKFKDRNPEIENLRLALAMVSINCDYPDIELLLQVQESVKEHGRKFSIDHESHIEWHWDEKWKKYFDEIKKEEVNETSD